MRDDDHDALMDQIMDQLGAALGEVDAAGLRSAVQDGLREALRALEDEPEAPAPLRSADGRPHVVVLDGGLSDAAAPDEAEVVTHDVKVEVEVGPVEESSVSRTVVLPRERSTAEGWLAPQGAWQTLYAGPAAATYRVAVREGEVDVLTDDQVVATLKAGQSCDVAGTRIVARGDGQGSYRPVSGT